MECAMQQIQRSVFGSSKSSKWTEIDSLGILWWLQGSILGKALVFAYRIYTGNILERFQKRPWQKLSMSDTEMVRCAKHYKCQCKLQAGSNNASYGV